MVIQDFTQKTKELIDNLKGICTNAGLGNDGNEFKIITQVFLYKFLNDKFGAEAKRASPRLQKAEKWEAEIGTFTDEEYEMLLLGLPPNTPQLKPHHFISWLFQKQNAGDFAKTFDDTLRDIAILNNDVFSVRTDSGAKIVLFDQLSQFVTDPSKRDLFCRAIINQLVEFNFEPIFDQKFDFFSTIFEYLIKDYNKDGGGKYAEYYTPHAVAKIMAAILVDAPTDNAVCYDPSAGSGTLLMNLAHAIGEDKCTIFSQDISQKSTGMLRLNLILNNLVHSLSNIVQGNTIREPFHKTRDGQLEKFDFIVSNPPFKLDFSDLRDSLDSRQNADRFFAGIPNIPNKDKDKMSIYLLFIQHIMHVLKPTGRAAIVVPTGFITAQSGIEKKIREKLIENRWLRGVVSMPSNIFATTGTNVSVLFLDKSNQKGDIVLMDASKLGKIEKDGKNQKTVLSAAEEQKIIDTFNRHEAVEDFSVVLSYEQIAEKNHSFSAGQYFEVKIEYSDLSTAEFAEKMADFEGNLKTLFAESARLEKEIFEQLKSLQYEK